MKWIAILLIAVGLLVGWSLYRGPQRARDLGSAEPGATPQELTLPEARQIVAAGGKKVSEPIQSPGWEYDGATVVEVFPDGLKVSHDAGIALVEYQSIPQDVRAKYGLAEASAKAFSKARNMVTLADESTNAEKRRQAIEANNAAFAADEARKQKEK